MTAADDIHKYFFMVFYDASRQRIHMKNEALFSSKDKSKKLECCLLQFLFGAMRVNRCKSDGMSECSKMTLTSNN